MHNLLKRCKCCFTILAGCFGKDRTPIGTTGWIGWNGRVTVGAKCGALRLPRCPLCRRVRLRFEMAVECGSRSSLLPIFSQSCLRQAWTVMRDHHVIGMACDHVAMSVSRSTVLRQMRMSLPHLRYRKMVPAFLSSRITRIRSHSAAGSKSRWRKTGTKTHLQSGGLSCMEILNFRPGCLYHFLISKDHMAMKLNVYPCADR